MRKLTFLCLLFTLCFNVLLAQVSENFDGWTETGGYGTYTYNGFRVATGLRETTTTNTRNSSTAAVRLQNSGTPYLEYEAGDGNGKDGGVGDISFWYRHWDGSPAIGTITVSYSVNGGGYTTIGTISSFTSTTYTQYTYTLNNSSDNIKIKVQTTGEERLIIDDFSITDYSGPSNDTDTEVETVAQPAAANISSLADTDGEAVDVFKFRISDQGTADGLATKVTNVRIKPHTTNTADWTDNIQGVKLNDGSAVTIGTPTITDTYIDIPITAGNMDVADAGTKDVTFSVYLNTGNISDGSILSFMIDADAHGFTADNSGSDFISTFTGGDFNSNNFTVVVAATTIAFGTQPSSALINENLSTFTINATDANGNTDTDESTCTVALTTDGTGMSSSSPYTFSSGVISVSDVQFSAANTNITITATAQSCLSSTAVSSNQFNITNFSYASGDYRPTMDYTGLSYNNTAGMTDDWEYYDGSSWGTTPGDKAPQNAATTPTRVIITKAGIDGGGNSSSTYNDIVIMSGGELILNDWAFAPTAQFLNNGKTITVKDGGILRIKGNIDMSNANIVVESGGYLYITEPNMANNEEFWNGTEDFQSGSYVVIDDWDWGASATARSIINIDADISYNTEGYKFGYLQLDMTNNSTDTWTIVGGPEGIINLCYNDFEITNPTAFYVGGASNKTGTNGFVVNGNMTINSGSFYFGTSYSADPFDHDFTINGDFTMNGTGTLQAHDNALNTSTALSGSVTFKGDVTIASGVTITNDKASDNSRIDFNFGGSTTQLVDIAATVQGINMNINNGAEVQLTNNNLTINSLASTTTTLSVLSGGTLNFGWAADNTPLLVNDPGTPTGTIAFSSASSSTLKITSADGISENTADLGNVQLPAADKTFDQSATFWYVGKVDQVTGDGISTTSNINRKLTIDLNTSSNKVQLTDDIIAGQITLTSGLVELINKNLSLGTATTEGTQTGGSASSYIITNGTGTYTRNQASTATDLLFPVGFDASNYNPATLNYTGTTDDFSMEVDEGIAALTGMSATESVNRTWNITEGTAGGTTASLSLQWETAHENGGFAAVRSDAIVMHLDGSLQEENYVSSSVSGSPYTTKSDGITTFSPFGVGKSATPLPVMLLSFTGKLIDGETQLEWRTASEINNAYFDIERSTDNKNFFVIDQVMGAGNSNTILSYTAVDENVIDHTINYYRLKQVDYDGRHAYSNVVAVDPKSDKANELEINWLGRDELWINSLSSLKRVTVINSIGQVVKTVPVSENKAYIKLNELPTGIYFLKINNTETVKTIRIKL